MLSRRRCGRWRSSVCERLDRRGRQRRAIRDCMSAPGAADVGDGEGGHVDDAAHGRRRRQDVHRLGGAEQDAADRDAVAGRDAQQVVGDVGGVEVGHHQQVGVRRRGASPGTPGRRIAFDSAASPCISPSTSSSDRASRISASASRIFRADGASELPKLECDSSATFGVMPKRRTSSAASSVDLGDLLGARVEVDVGVADEQLAAGQHQHLHRRAACATPSRRPITSRM